MLTIRLQRTGKKNQADFRIVLAEKEAPVKKKIVEILGSYNPRKKDFKVREERVKYWISQRVELSETVHNLFVTKNLLEGKKVKAFTIPKKVEPADAKAMAGEEKPAAILAPAQEASTPSVNETAPAEATKIEAVVDSSAEVPQSGTKAEASKAGEKPAEAIPEAVE